MLVAALLALLIAAGQTAAPAGPAADCAGLASAEAATCAALAAHQAGRPAEAAAAFEAGAASLAAEDPRRDRLLAAAGSMWLAAAEPGKAAQALDRALAGTALAGEQRGEALLDRAQVAEAQGDLAGARARIVAATPLIGENRFLWYFSARLALRENDRPAAAAAIARALAIAPSDPLILFEAGHVAQFSGDEARARGYWNSAAAADPLGSTGQAARDALALLTVPLTLKAK